MKVEVLLLFLLQAHVSKIGVSYMSWGWDHIIAKILSSMSFNPWPLSWLTWRMTAISTRFWLHMSSYQASTPAWVGTCNCAKLHQLTSWPSQDGGWLPQIAPKRLCRGPHSGAPALAWTSHLHDNFWPMTGCFTISNSHVRLLQTLTVAKTARLSVQFWSKLCQNWRCFSNNFKASILL